MQFHIRNRSIADNKQSDKGEKPRSNAKNTHFTFYRIETTKKK